jgi:hypothetical protein
MFVFGVFLSIRSRAHVSIVATCRRTQDVEFSMRNLKRVVKTYLTPDQPMTEFQLATRMKEFGAFPTETVDSLRFLF